MTDIIFRNSNAAKRGDNGPQSRAHRGSLGEERFHSVVITGWQALEQMENIHWKASGILPDGDLNFVVRRDIFMAHDDLQDCYDRGNWSQQSAAKLLVTASIYEAMLNKVDIETLRNDGIDTISSAVKKDELIALIAESKELVEPVLSADKRSAITIAVNREFAPKVKR